VVVFQSFFPICFTSRRAPVGFAGYFGPGFLAAIGFSCVAPFNSFFSAEQGTANGGKESKPWRFIDAAALVLPAIRVLLQ
jgi:hypothetical protein